MGCDRYQTGALTPIVRWLSQGMTRAAAPPHPPRPAVRAENVPAAGRLGAVNAAVAGKKHVSVTFSSWLFTYSLIERNSTYLDIYNTSRAVNELDEAQLLARLALIKIDTI